MTNQEVIEKIKAWQNCSFVHPLTCGNNGMHKDLVPREVNSKIILACPDCDYTQVTIPKAVLSNCIELIHKAFDENSA